MNKQLTDQNSQKTQQNQLSVTNAATNTPNQKTKPTHKKIITTTIYTQYENILYEGNRDSISTPLKTVTHCPHCKETYVRDIYTEKYISWTNALEFSDTTTIQTTYQNKNKEETLSCQKCEEIIILNSSKATFTT